MATMIGLGVGIDYALFLLSRHRRLLADGVPVRRVGPADHGQLGRRGACSPAAR